MSDEFSDGATALIDELAERLLEAATSGRFAEELVLADQLLEARRDELESGEIVRARVLFFDLALVSTNDRRLQANCAIELLSVLDGDDWAAVLRTNRIDDLRQLTDEPELGLELIELLVYAPDVEVQMFATSRLEAMGMERSMNGLDVRSIERLLHATGASDAAYRLEAARKHRLQRELPSPRAVAPAVPSLPYSVIAIAGGHAQLRTSAAALLEPYGISIVPIPSSREAVRRERDILEAMQGCELVLLLVRQITHSTSDQVRKSAERLGIPVVFSNAASAVAIERQLLERARMDAKE